MENVIIQWVSVNAKVIERSVLALKRVYYSTMLFLGLFCILAGGCTAGKSVTPGTENKSAPPAVTNQLGKVAFVNQGKLFVRDLDKGTSVQITTYQNVYYPKWSSSGKWLLFQRGHQLWVSKADGFTNRMVAPETQSFTWLANKNSICYASSGEGLVVTKPEGDQSQVLLKPLSQLQISKIVPSSDGMNLALEIAGSSPKDGIVSEGIWKFTLNTGKFTPVLQGGVSSGKVNPEKPPGSRPRLAGWSADGQVIYAWNGAHSSSLTADGLSFSAFNAKTGQQLFSATEGLIHSGWFRPSPKGEMAALITGTSRETWVNKKLTLIDRKTKQYYHLSKPNTTVNSLSFSPGGDLLAFSAGKEEKRFYDGGASDYGAMAQKVMGDRHLYTTTLDGKDLVQLTNDSVYRDEYPLWSTKGDYLLFARVDSSQNASLWSISKDGKDLKSVVLQLSPFDWFGYYGFIDWQQYFDYLP